MLNVFYTVGAMGVFDCSWSSQSKCSSLSLQLTLHCFAAAFCSHRCIQKTVFKNSTPQ